MAGALPSPPFDPGRLRLGHIVYSNCFPVHARLLDRPAAGDPLLVEGIPSVLNGMLAEGRIDVAPCSSIEYAAHAERYRILPDLVIGSSGRVRSIVFLADREPRKLQGCRVALPTASATSVVLLKILLRTRWQVEARFEWFDQASEDPFAMGAAAALFIGDVALRPDLHRDKPVRLDLGHEWQSETGLPFAFAIWQAGGGNRAAVRRLHETLVESRKYGERERLRLAERYARHFATPAPELARYWSDLVFQLNEPMVEGLRTFYRLAAEIGEISAVPALRWSE